MGLSIVKFDPNDYKLGEALSIGNGEKITDTQQISQVLSLYFQWEHKSKCQYYVTSDRTFSIDAKIEFDNEEREITQLYFVSSTDLLETNEWLFTRIEIFDTCYEFECRVLESFAENSTHYIITELPKEIISVKLRKATRIHTSSKIVVTTQSGNKLEVETKSITLFSAKLSSKEPLPKTITIHLTEASLIGESIRQDNDSTVYKVYFESAKEAGAWFDYYRLFAFPNLVKRSELSVTECLNLYDKSGYFDKYSVIEKERLTELLTKEWQNLKEVEHTATSDYIVRSENQIPTGIGSNSLTYKKPEESFWTFHSLCALKEIDSLEQTKQLYSWRAEYNLMRPENVSSLMYFSSTSRWIERVYIRFILRKSQSNLIASRIYSMIFHPKNHGIVIENISLSTNTNRLQYISDDFMVAALPDHLHIRKKLNCITAIKPINDPSELIKAAEQIAFEAKQDIEFRVCIPEDSKWLPEAKSDAPTDRIGIIKKIDLLEFVTNLNHSIEVTKLKKKGA